GRGELHPSSDIDLMVVYDGELSPYVQRMMQELLYTLWDLGLQVGHSLRSLEDCVAMARTDFPSRTSMQEARLVVGDKRLFARFGRVLHDNVYWHDFQQFLATTLRSRELQPRIAKNLGYENEDDALGVERFMREYYLNARAIHRVSKRLIARCHETLAVRGSAERRQRQQALADGLVFFDGRLHRADRDPNVLRRDPVR